MTDVMRRLAGGDYGVQIPALELKNEIGEMARAVDVLRASAIERKRLEAEQAAARAARERERERAAEERARAAEEQAEVVDASARDCARLPTAISP